MAAMSSRPFVARPAFQRPVSCLLLAALGGCVVAPHRGYHGGHHGYSSPPPTTTVTAPPLYFYPEQGQAEPQQDRDRYECYRWASAQTGADPGMTPLRVPRAP